MKKVLIAIVLLAAVGYGGYYFFVKEKSKKKESKPQALELGENSGTFNMSYQQLLSAYFNLKDALVASDTTKANSASKVLLGYSDSLKIDEIKDDTSGVIKETARTFTSTISGSAIALMKENSIEAKRREFEMISDALYTLTQTVKYGGQKIYYQYCPMAFDNKGAYWLSEQSEIRNPYFGDKMLECGEVRDTLDYSRN
jgi:Cu(I)/Ag(I) efflux system membrane fusion protein